MSSFEIGAGTVAVVACATDLAYRRVPNVLTAPALVAGLLAHGVWSGGLGLPGALLGAAVGLAVFFPIFALGGMGGGDVKLMAALGSWVGAGAIGWTALYAAVAGGVLALVVGAAHGYLRQAFSNIGGLLVFWSVHGPRPVAVPHPGARLRAAAPLHLAHPGGPRHGAMAALTPRARWSSERGAELIEMVIVLPLLLLMLFGIIDFGFMFQRYVVLTNAAMEGARVGILPGYSTADARSTRRGLRVTTGRRPGGRSGRRPSIPVSLTDAGGAPWPGMQVTVTHPYTYQFIGPIASIFGSSFSTVTLTARSTMRRQLGS